MGIEALLTSQVIGLDAALTGKLNTSGGTVTGQLTNALGTITASTPLTISQTWNNAAVSFNPLLVSVTDTQSASGSLLMDLQVGGTSKFSVQKDANVRIESSGLYVGSYALDSGISVNTNGMSVVKNGSAISGCGDSGWHVTTNRGYHFGANASTLVLSLYYDADDTLAQRRSTNAQTFRLYNTYTSATSFENLQLQWSSNEARIGTSVGSAGGTFREMKFGYWNSAGTFSTGITVRTDGLHVGGTGGPQLTNAESNLFIGGGTNTDKVMILTGGRTINAGTGAFNESFISLAGRTHPTVASSVTVALKNSGVFRVLDSSDVSRFECTATGAATLSGQLTNALGTITASTPATFTQTWNSLATVFTGLKVEITDTTSSPQSVVADFRIGSTSVAAITKDGLRLRKNISGTIDTFLETSATTAGGDLIIRSSAGGNTFRFVAYSNDCYCDNSAAGAWYFRNSGPTVRFAVTSEGGIQLNNNQVTLIPDAANTLAQRNSTNAQTFRIYNTYTSSTSYERGKIAWESNVLVIGTEKGSAGGSARDLELNASGGTNLYLSSGNQVFVKAVEFYVNNTGTASNTGIRLSGNGLNSLYMQSSSTDLHIAVATSTAATVIGKVSDKTVGLKVSGLGDITIQSNTTINDACNIAIGTTTGTKIGTGTTQKIGFYDKTPVVQPTAVADATDAASVITQLNALLSRMRDLGLIAT